nr:hypothetical protein [Tanacetum cinerariifolium]
MDGKGYEDVESTPVDDDKAIDYETLDVKSLIVDCESQVLGTNEAGDVHIYKLTRLDGSYRHFSTFSRMLEFLDRKDVLDLHKIVMERFSDSDPEGYDLILWGDLKTLVESMSEDILRRRARFDGFNDWPVEDDMTTIRLFVQYRNGVNFRRSILSIRRNCVIGTMLASAETSLIFPMIRLLGFTVDLLCAIHLGLLVSQY